MKRQLILLLPFILLLLYNAKAPEKETVSYTIIQSNDVEPLHYIGYKGPKLEILSDNEMCRNFYLRLHIDENPKFRAPSVDFTSNRVLFISFGKYRNAVHSLKRLNIYLQNNVLIVKTDLSPPEYDFISSVLTHHYLLVLLPKDGYKGVEWRDYRGGRLCETVWETVWIN